MWHSIDYSISLIYDENVCKANLKVINKYIIRSDNRFPKIAIHISTFYENTIHFKLRAVTTSLTFGFYGDCRCKRVCVLVVSKLTK